MNEDWKKQHREFREGLMGLLPRGVRHFRPQPPYFSGYEYSTLYDWDQYFEAIVLAYCNYPIEYVRNGVRLFFNLQRPDGYIPRSFTPGTGVYYKHDVMFKPFLAQLVLLTTRQDGDLSWLKNENVLEKLARYYDYWTGPLDPRGAGLSVWHECEHTGMDNHYARAGKWGRDIDFCEGVDLNSYLVREAEALAALSDLVGDAPAAARYRASAETRREAMCKWLWNDEQGFFFDYDRKEGHPVPVKYAGSFIALWAGIPTAEQAERIVKEHLLNEKEFWRAYPIPALAADDPGYCEGFLPGERNTYCNWRANTWMPVNYMAVHGLLRYGYTAIAQDLAQRSFDLFDRGHFCEYYTSDSGLGTGLKPFWGWSALAIFLPLEAGRGIDPTALSAHPFTAPLHQMIAL